MHDYLRVVCVGRQRGQSRIARLGSYSGIIQSYREDEGKRAYDYRVGFYHGDETTLRLILLLPMRHDHVFIWSYTAEDMMIHHDMSYGTERP
jgi:hypothetical protein